jgi:starch-binding outer membrane protein, SusD/RagB family
MKFNKIFASLAVVALFASCTKDLDRTPAYGLNAESLYKNEAGYRSSLAKVYGGLALTGNSGPDGSGDLGGIDEGFSSYLRNYWNLQELPTDEAVIAWNDQTIKDFHNMSWTPADNFNAALYARIYFQITLANDFIRNASDANLSKRGIAGADLDKVKLYKAEARFLRALSYWHALDLYGSPTFVTDEDPIGAYLPKNISRAALFAWIEKECLAIEPALTAPKANEYGRVDKAGLWMLMANLYLNAQVYTGTAKNTEAVTYANKVIAASYTLTPNYRHLFLADNHTSTEVIFPITFDGNFSRTWGGTTYLAHAPVGGDMNATEFGLDGGWGGLRTTSALVNKFTDITGNTDVRANFQIAGQNLNINNVGEFRDGYSIRKWKNVTSAGAPGKNATWVDIDFPMFRLGEAYLIYAEAVLRGGAGGTTSQAITYVNALRKRAYSGAVDLTALTLQGVLDERARELHWEGKRRTDLIRYDQFTTAAYLWPLKGGDPNGKAVEIWRNLYPIPAAQLNTNTNLVQNTGYSR